MWHRLHQGIIWQIGNAASMHFHGSNCAWAIDKGSADHCMQEHGTVEQFCMQQLVRWFCELGQAYGQTWGIVRRYVLFAVYTMLLLVCHAFSPLRRPCVINCWYIVQLIIWRQPAGTNLSHTRNGTDSGRYDPKHGKSLMFEKTHWIWKGIHLDIPECCHWG